MKRLFLILALGCSSNANTSSTSFDEVAGSIGVAGYSSTEVRSSSGGTIEVQTTKPFVGNTFGVAGTSNLGGSNNNVGSAGIAGVAGIAGTPIFAGSAGIAGEPILDRSLPFYEPKPGYCAVYHGQSMVILEWFAKGGWQLQATEYSCYSSGNPVRAFGALSIEEQPADGTWASGTKICKKCFCEADGSWWQGVAVE